MAIKTIEQFRSEATTEIESEKPKYASVDNTRREFTKNEYDQAIEDRAQFKLDQQNNGYKRKRQEAYGDIADQLDMLYHDMAADKGDKTGDWFAAIKKVKDDNPKPS